MADRTHHKTTRVGLAAVALAVMAALLVAGCGPETDNRACWPNACKSDGPAAPAPVIDAGVPTLKGPGPAIDAAPPTEHHGQVLFNVTDEHGADVSGQFTVVMTTVFRQPPNGTVIYDGRQWVPVTEQGTAPVYQPVNWVDPIPGADVTGKATIPGGYTIECQSMSDAHVPMNYDFRTAPAGGSWSLAVTCPVVPNS